MRCSNCGAMVADGVTFCTNCGANLQAPKPQQTYNGGFNPQAQNTPNQQYGGGFQQPYQQQPYQQAGNTQDVGIGLKILSLLIPIVGIILYFVKKDSQPVGAKSCLTWGLAGIAVSFVCGILF